MNALQFPRHACGLFLTHNEHLDYYETVEQWLLGGMEEHWSFKDADARARAVASNECWTLQWYPNTPIGFYAVAAPTLEEVLELALEVEALP